MGDFSLQDTIGGALAAWSAVERAKIDARLQQSREQALAYDLAAVSAAQQKAQTTTPAWLLPALGFVALGLVVWVAAK